MKQQVLVIHGGTTFAKYSDYISFLQNREVDLERLRAKEDWKNNLAGELGRDYEVLLPRMPNGTNARYREWKIWFKRLTPFFENNVIMIGHSLGGVFLAKYLSENTYPKKIKAVILVSAPFDDSDSHESLGSFRVPVSLAGFSGQCRAIYLIHSRNDPVVPFTQLEKYKQALPEARVVIFEDREHFNQPDFPELVGLIKQVSSH